ncbi:EamA family transporter [Roseofilum capinflatum]|uniref:EamA family transporter n=1 Tax=Roseofilum capinflatum BLCC-M114 TaxID=3022440 RepID=A0ABT7B3C0_9CYAN|nr:EamA family transporter [Roseofilum capinflatum]MDJ1173672.1 EamA family transporter [Roseofilum capinflatum BLCC-M114]
MTLPIITYLIACVFSISLGQLLFKLAANFSNTHSPQGLTLMSYLSNPYLWSALIIYGSATLFWMWLLRFIPLNQAYPFMALAFVIVPLLSSLFLGEKVDARYLVGVALIMSGLIIMNYQ